MGDLIEQEFRLGLGIGFRVRVSVSDVTWSYISRLITDINRTRKRKQA